MNKDFFKNAAYYGLLMTAAFVLVDLFFYVFDMTQMGMFVGLLIILLFLGLYLVAFIWGGRTYRNNFMDGHINYGKAFIFCLSMALTCAIAMFVYHLLFYFVFDTERAMHDAQKGVEMIQNNPYIPEDKKQGAINDLALVSKTKTVLKSLQSSVIFGIIFSAIAALFVRKKEKFTEVF